MNKAMGWFVACSMGLFACHVESYEDCPSDDDFGVPYAKAGSTSKAGSSSHDDGGSTSNGGSAGSGSTSQSGGGTSAGAADDAEGGAGAAPGAPQPVPCKDEHDCPAGYNCNLDVHECQAAAEETCGELTTEAACTHRTDCTPVYAGVNCSCGKDCECHGGEPGCVCESFEFFVCQATK